MAGKFELFKDKNGEIRWHLKAANGEIVASSQGYKTRDAAEKGIASVINNARDAEVADAAVGADWPPLPGRTRATSGIRHRSQYQAGSSESASPKANPAKRHLHAAGVFDSGRSDISERMEELLAAEVEQ